MIEIIEAEYIKIQTPNDQILDQICNSIDQEYLHITNHQDLHHIRLKLRKYSFNLLTYFARYFDDISDKTINPEIISDFLTEDEFYIDYDEEYPLSYPIPIDPNLVREFCSIFLSSLHVDDDNYIWILPNTNNRSYYTIKNVKFKLSTDHTNFIGKIWITIKSEKIFVN